MIAIWSSFDQQSTPCMGYTICNTEMENPQINDIQANDASWFENIEPTINSNNNPLEPKEE